MTVFQCMQLNYIKMYYIHNDYGHIENIFILGIFRGEGGLKNVMRKMCLTVRMQIIIFLSEK